MMLNLFNHLWFLKHINRTWSKKVSIARILTLLTSGFVANSVFAAESPFFKELELSLPYAVSQPPLLADVAPNPGKELIIVGSGLSNAHQVSVVGIEEGKLAVLDSFAIGKEYFAIDTLDSSTEKTKSLFFLSREHLASYEFPADKKPNRLHLYQEVDSFYRVQKSNFLSRIDFIDDLNEDGIADITLPNFDYLTVWLSKKDAELKRHRLNIPSMVSIVRLDLEVQQASTTKVNGEQPFIFYTEQGHVNQFTIEKNHIREHRIKVNETIYGVNWWDLLDDSGNSQDQSNLSHRVVEKITDVNGDDIPDMVVRFTRSRGALDRQNDYEFYYGKLDDSVLSFSDKPDTTIASEGTLTGLILEDIDGDKKKEVIVSSFEIGVSQIVSALLSGSIDQDVLVYRLNKNQGFDKKPNSSYETQMHFSLSKGRAGEPLVAVADINGDGYKDLLLTANNEEIRIRFGMKDGKFSRSERVKTTVPQAGGNIQAQDMNGDGKLDVTMVYDRLDEPTLKNMIKVLVAK